MEKNKEMGIESSKNKVCLLSCANTYAASEMIETSTEKTRKLDYP
jgi:hypothetical protein